MDSRDKKELKKLGLHIRSLRVKKDYTQEEFADRASLSVSQIGRIERGILNPSFVTLLAIARALKVNLERVVAYEE